MDFSVAVVGDGFVLLAADTAQARSIVVMKQSKSFFSLFFAYPPPAALARGCFFCEIL
jgi:hypothetical protein